jgi:bifunctional DNA-binding transcriptional regulator/antitoxin component of YhaV-PrlF toxin-antitoxin module
MLATEVDDQGRLYLPKSTRERYGTRFRIVGTRRGIRLVPGPEDPVEGLREAMSGVKGASLERLREQASKAARDDALR